MLYAAAGDQAIYRQEAGDGWRQIQARVHAAWAGHPLQAIVEQRQGQQTQPEHRHTYADQRDEARQVIRPAVALHGSKHPQRHAAQHGEEGRAHRKFHSCREVTPDIRCDRLLGDDGLAQVAAQQVAHVRQVSLVRRFVQPPSLAISLHDLRVGHRALGEHHRQRVCRNEVRNDEAEQRHQQQQRDGDDDATHEVAEQRHR